MGVEELARGQEPKRMGSPQPREVGRRQDGRAALGEGQCLGGPGGYLQGVILSVFPLIPSLEYLHPVPVYP